MNQPDVAATPAVAAGAATLCSDMVTPYTQIAQSVLENSGFLRGKYYKMLFLSPLRTASNACKHLGVGEMAPPYIPELAPRLKCTA